MTSDFSSSPPLRRQLFFHFAWLAQLWATGASPSPPVQTTLERLVAFETWTVRRWSIANFLPEEHADLVAVLDQRLERFQSVALLELLDAASQIPGNGSAEETAIALRFLSSTERQPLLQDLMRQWMGDGQLQWLLRLGRSRPDRAQPPKPSDIRSQLNGLFDGSDADTQALSLFLLHQLSPAEGQALATQLLSQRVRLSPALDQVAKAILATPAGEAVAIARCSRLTQLPPPPEPSPSNHRPAVLPEDFSPP